MRTSKFFEAREGGDLFFTGPLDSAVECIKRERTVHVFTEGKQASAYMVGLSDCEANCAATTFDDCPDVAEWGAGATEEEAMRYALAAAFGPLDEEYQGDEYLAWLLGVEVPA